MMWLVTGCNFSECRKYQIEKTVQTIVNLFQILLALLLITGNNECFP